MWLNAFVAVLAFVVACATVSAYPPIYSDEPHAVTDSGSSDDGGYALPQFNFANAHLQQQHRVHNNKPIAATKVSASQSPATAEAISATMAVSPPSLQSAYVYSAQVPTHIQPEANKVVNAVKLASSTAAAMSAALSPSTQNDFTGTYQSTSPSDNAEMYIDWSKKTIGSSAPSSVAVVLNGNEPEFTDALGQKVPKPLPSLQVASPIDLLNPDRYEFFTFDENGELVKRLMTMEEIQSIVANGDGEGPTIIHHGPVEDRDPEKNVQDIVNSVQDVLNKEVESNKNSSSNILPVLDTPDVSASWSMILPAIFGNTGGVDIFTHQKPQQIVMTPDTEIIETSTKASKTNTTKKSKPNKRKPGQKRKPSATTSTTEVTPQVIQEELESHESVYTGMQQYQHLAATMQNYDGFSQLHMQPIYHKLPEQLQVESTTKRILMNNQGVVQKPLSDDTNLTENQGKKPVSVQHKPLPPHRVSGGSTTTKRPQSTKQKTKRKPTTTTTTRPETTTSAEIKSPTPEPTTNSTSTTTQAPMATTEAIVITTSSETEPVVATPVPSTEAPSKSTTATIPTVTKKKKKKPTRQPIHTSSTQNDVSSNNTNITSDHRNPFPKPHRPRPTYKPQITTTDLTAEGSAHQEVSHNKHQHVTYHRPRPKPQKPTMSPVTSTTVVIAPVPVSTVPTPLNSSLIVEKFPGYVPSNTVAWAKVTTVVPKLPTTATNVLPNSGTAGYPVPAYAISTEKYEDYDGNRYTKKPLLNLPIIHHTASKPYQDQDIHTMQSFDQILQSLKQPEISAEKIDYQIEHSVKPPLSPVKYDSAENMEQLEEIANKHMVPVINSMSEGPTTNLPIYTHHGSNTLSTTVADLETSTDSSTIVSEESTITLQNAAQFLFTTEQPEIQITTTIPREESTIDVNIEETKETGTFKYTPPGIDFETSTQTTEIIDTTTESSEKDTDTSTLDETTEAPYSPEELVYSTEPQMQEHETTTKRLPNQPTLFYVDDLTTDSVDTLKEITEHLNIQTRLPVTLPHNKDIVTDDDRDNYNQPILVADLKPQLNMEVLKPSEQISMSDFQTQAATVASTLVDGTNTLAVDYNMLSSNETKDEIAFLMSDVIKQMSNIDTIPTSEQANNSEKTASSNSALSISQSVQIGNVKESNNDLGPITVHTSSNNNRYSNIAKLNTTFITEPHNKNSFLPSYGGTDVMDDHKFTYERFEDSPLIDVSAKDVSVETTTIASETISTVVVEDTTGEATTELAEAMREQEKNNSIEDSSSIEDLITTTVRENEDPSSYEKTTVISQTVDYETKNDSFGLKKDDRDEISNMSATESDEVKSDILDKLNESNDKSTTIKIPILSLSEIYTKQQANNDEREALFEADDSIDTTTQIISLSEETTDSQWQIASEGDIRSETSENVINTTVGSTVTTVTDNSISEMEMQEPTDKFLTSDDIENTTVLSTESSEEDKLQTETETASVKEFTEDLDNIMSSVTQEDTTLRYESYSINSSEPPPEDSESNATDLEPQRLAEITTEESMKEISTESIEDSTHENYTKLPEKDEEETTFAKSQESYKDIGNTTLNYQMSEETSEELNAMVSEEDETEELVDEDPYIKLGETTTTKSLESTTTSSFEINKLKLESAESEMQPVIQSEQKNKLENIIQAVVEPVKQSDEKIMARPKPIKTVNETQAATDVESILLGEDLEQIFEGADEEDEDDQIGYRTTKLPEFSSTTTASTPTTTAPKPTVTTTRRLNTLKPVSYFNKQPAYALFQDVVEPLYNKPVFYGQPQQETVPNKVITYTIPSAPQRPMQRPPQLSNLMITSTQATRPPVKLEPSPTNSKGLEASLANLDGDILSFARLCNELAFSYWKSITSEKISSTRSLVLSPFALTSMLSMVFLGARGSTSGEMNDVLKLDDMVTFNPHLVFKNITDSVEKAMDSDIATTAFVREVFSDRANGKILQFFKEKTQQLYSGHVEEVNFHVVNDIIRRRTNLLVKRHTMGKVLEYLRTNSVWVNGPLATISANLFQTDCSQGSTHERDGEIFFQVHPTVRQRRLVPIPAVLFKSGFTAGYEPNLETTVVAFGRIQDTTSLIYVMPGHHSSFSPSDNLDRLEKQLMETAISKNAWSNLLTSLMDRPGMEVQLPRFSHRSFVNATLGLQKMGLKGLFKSDFADLGGLTGSSNRDIYLSDMIQINTFSTCGEEKIADHHHVEMYPAPPLRKRNKDVDAHQDDDFDSSEAIIDFGSLVQDSALGRGFYDDLLDPKYLELPLPLRPRQARVPDSPRLRFDKPFLYFVRHNPTGMILFMGRFNPRLLP